MKVDAVIVAAGSSTRFGDEDKLFIELGGRPLLAWPLAAYEAVESVERVIVVAGQANLARVAELAREWAPTKFASVVSGGARRRDSVESGLNESRARYVAIHDGARPLTTSGLIELCINSANGLPGAIVATRVVDTIKAVHDGVITAHPDRSSLWAAQTPQVVLRQAWLDAAGMSDNDETDDAAMLSRLGLECVVVEGDSMNLKVTRPLDLEVARLILAAREGQ